MSLTSPADGDVVSGSALSLSAAASDNIGVVGVQFLRDGNPLGPEDMAAPYTFQWDTRTTLNGSYVLAARARDAAGNLATSTPVTVTVDNNYALDFDGIDDVVVAPSAPPPLQLSVSAWIFPRSLGENNTGNIFTIRAASGNDPNIQFRLLNNNRLYFLAIFDSGGSLSIGSWATPAGSIALNTLQHVAVVYDANSTATAPVMYINGSPQTLTVVRSPAGILNTAPAPWLIGNSPAGNGTFDGILDEVRVYSRLLSTADVQAQFNNGQIIRLGPELGLLAGWHFDEGAGAVAADFSGNNFAASLLNGLKWILH